MWRLLCQTNMDMQHKGNNLALHFNGFNKFGIKFGEAINTIPIDKITTIKTIQNAKTYHNAEISVPSKIASIIETPTIE